MDRELVSKCIAEFIGTFALVFAGCGAMMVQERFGGNSFTIPIVFGLVVATMIYAVGHISGAHFNPAVTLSFSLVRRFPVGHLGPYWASQFLGGLFAIMLLALLLPAGSSYGATIPAIEPWRAVVWECVLTFLLMFVIVSVATDTRAEGTMAGMAIGGTVALCSFFGGPVTGSSMNPARSLAPNLMQGQVDSLWIYILGPFIGAIAAAFIYEYIRCGDNREARIPMFRRMKEGTS